MRIRHGVSCMAKRRIPKPNGVLNFGKVTLATASGLSPWWFILLIVAGAVYGPLALSRWEKARPLKASRQMQD